MDRFFSGLTFLLMTALAISACGSTETPQPATSTPTPTSTTMATAIESATPEPTATVTETATPLPTPTDQGDCINRAEFVSDVTIPDYTNVKPGEKFIKTWRIRNAGSCIWNLGYALVFLKGAQMSAPYSSPFVETPPGSTLDVSLEMAAPAQDGVFTGVYQIQGPSGKRFGIRNGNIWVRIAVGSGTSVPTTPTYTP